MSLDDHSDLSSQNGDLLWVKMFFIDSEGFTMTISAALHVARAACVENIRRRPRRRRNDLQGCGETAEDMFFCMKTIINVNKC
jgi:hypothetical protein